MAGNKAKRFLSFNHTTKTYYILQKHTTKTSSSIHCALTDNDMLIMVGKELGEEYVTKFIEMQELKKIYERL